MQRDRGLQLRLTLGPATAIKASNHYRVDLPDSNGAEDFEENITDCNPANARFGDTLAHEPADMAAATRAAIQDLDRTGPGRGTGTRRRSRGGRPEPEPARLKVVPVFDRCSGTRRRTPAATTR